MTARPQTPFTRVARPTTAAIVGAVCLVAALSNGCRTPPPPLPDEPMKTDPALVSRDPKAAERRRATIQSWVEDSLLGSYAAVGRRSPKWDAHVERAFRLAARRWTSDATAPADLADRIWTETSQAQAAGCDDPLVAYVRYRFSGNDAPLHELKDTFTRLDASAYPAHWKGWAALALEQGLRPCCLLSETDPGKAFRATHVARARAHLPELVADRTMPTRRVIQYANRLLQAYMWLDEEYEAHYQDVRAAIVAARGEQDPSLPLLEAWFHVRLANAARGSKWAGETSRAQFEAHAREMRVADDLAARTLTSADPADLAELMSAVAWGLGERAALEEWFTTGTRLEPGNYTWYDDKVSWLRSDGSAAMKSCSPSAGRCSRRVTGRPACRWSCSTPTTASESDRPRRSGITRAPTSAATTRRSTTACWRATPRRGATGTAICSGSSSARTGRARHASSPRSAPRT